MRFTSFSFLPVGLLLLPLEAFHSMLFNSVGFQFVNQMGWIIMRGAESSFAEMLPLFILK